MPALPPPVQKKYKYADSVWCVYMVSVVAAWNAELVTYPLDLAKTRLQIQGEIANKKNGEVGKTPYRGLFRTAVGIVKEEGALKLWQGAHAALYRHLIYSGTRIVTYKSMKEKLVKNEEYFPVWKSALCGVTAGAFAQYLASPTDLLKTQLQMEGKRKLMGLAPRVDGLFDAFKKTVASAGYRGLWRGSIPNVQRAALVNLGDLTTYDSAKRFILRNTSLEDNHFVHCLASCGAGFVAASMGTPADVVKTRVMNQPMDENGKGVFYKTSIDCLQKTVRNEGVGALYKGFLPIWMRMAPWSLTFWLSYEEVISVLGAEQFYSSWKAFFWKMPKFLKKTKSNVAVSSAIVERIHILQWLPKYTKSDFVADLIAGLTVGLTMMPQSIAYASLAGLPAQYGLYTAFIGSFTYVFFGTIKEVSIGPTSLMALLTLSYTEDLPVDFVVLLTFLAGCVEFLMGLFNLGILVDFISPCVTSGFTSAMSVTLFVSQLKNLFGLRKLKNHRVFDVLHKIVLKYKEIRMADTMLGLSCIVFLLIFKYLPVIRTRSKFTKKILWLLSISKNIFVVVLTSLLAYYYHDHEGWSPFILSGDVPSGLPTVQLPPFRANLGNETLNFFQMVHVLGSSIFVVPLAAVLANVAIAKAFIGMIVNATQEMMTLGLCNIFGAFIQAMPSCGAFTRSAVASSSDVRTPLQGIYSGTAILLALSFLTPYFYYIPRTTLSAILITAIVPMFDYEIFPKLWRCNKFDFFLTLATLLIGVFYGVEIGIVAGGLLNMIILLKQWARPEIVTDIRVDNQGNDYVYVKPELGLYYAATDYLSTRITEVHNKTPTLPVVLDCSNVLRIDYAACATIDNMVKNFNKQSVKMMLLNVQPHVFRVLKNTIDFGNLRVCESVENLGEENANKIHECEIPLIEQRTKDNV